MVGDIDREKLVQSFSRIRQDIEDLNAQIRDLREENKQIKQENALLRQQIHTPLSKDIISDIVKETVDSIDNRGTPKVKKFRKKRRSVVMNRIHNLAHQKNLTVPEIKDIIVDQESLCSKATFYRYIKKMKKRQLIDIVKIEDMEVVVSI